MRARSLVPAFMAVVCLGALVCSASAAPVGAHASVAAGRASGFVPAQDEHSALVPFSSNLLWHRGPVMHSTTVVPIFWGSSWSSSTFTRDKISGLDYWYSHVGGSGYLHTNSEYVDGSGHVGLAVKKEPDLNDWSGTPPNPPSAQDVLIEVGRMTNGQPVPNAYYPVYSTGRRNGAGYCAWHSTGTINGVRVQFGFFFVLDGDGGCDPQAPTNLGHTQGLSALANVSGHELSEMLTDPQLNAWWDRDGAENSDKCAWTFDGLVTIGSEQWKIQGNWSNAAANAGTGYTNVGCVQTS
jgi:hypothetical protein